MRHITCNLEIILIYTFLSRRKVLTSEAVKVIFKKYSPALTLLVGSFDLIETRPRYDL